VAIHHRANLIDADGQMFVLIPTSGGVRFANPDSRRIFRRGEIPPVVRWAGRITTPIPLPAAASTAPVARVPETIEVPIGDGLSAIDEITEILGETDRERPAQRHGPGGRR
jgi:hypothetical protein